MRFVLLIFTLGIALADWLSVGTERLYLGDNSDPNQPIDAATQRFAIVGQNVVPQIITRNNAHFSFPVSFELPQKLVFKLKPAGTASYQIYLRDGASRRLITAETLSKSESRSIWMIRCTGTLEFVGEGVMTWTDLRLVRAFSLGPVYLIIIVALLVPMVRRRQETSRRAAELFTLVASTVITLGVAEGVLRAFAPKLPPIVAAARHGFGSVSSDTRLIDLHRYNLRLRPNLDTFLEWRHGDIARWGVIPESASSGLLHRYPFRTDSEGFRNPAVREKIDVAALGDSFTDAATSPVEESWPAQLEKITGWMVQNFGTSGFGPQQELYALEDFALKRKPKWTVLAFFGANDLHDAEAFDDWERAGRPASQDAAGWKLIRSFRRYQTQYLWTLANIAIESMGRRTGPVTDQGDRNAWQPQAGFKDGVFTIPAGGRLTRFAFMPDYLRKMALARPELEQSRGWEITRATLRQMNAECIEAGSKLVVMVVPSKEQVYWPLVQSAVTPGTLQEALDYYGRSLSVKLRPEDLAANRLELNLMMRDFCTQENILLLDLTTVLREKFESGDESYFLDDSHWNAEGHGIAAEQLAAFLQSSKP